MRATYHHGGYPDLDIDWGYPENVDLTGYTLTLTVFPFGGATAFTKFDGFTIQPPVSGVVPSPNLTLSWSQAPTAELDGLADGTYVMKFVATKAAAPTLEMYGELVIRINAPNFGYCDLKDLALGDLAIAPSINPYDFINSAADQINAEIGQRYALPLDLTSAPPWVEAKLRVINADLATGLLIMAQAQATQDKQLNAYGYYLVENSMKVACGIRDGNPSLIGVPLDPRAIRSNAPEGRNHDAASAVDAFENFGMRRSVFRHLDDRWRPGAT